MRWRCSRCGSEHEGLPLDWAVDAPAYWDGGRTQGDQLSDDMCMWTDDDGRLCLFVRGLIEILILETGGTFAYGVWSSLSNDSFNRFVELWNDPRRVAEAPYFGWLSNSLPGYPETLGLPLDVMTPGLDRRPSFRLHDGDHPLVREQREGITMERVRDIAELNLHGRVT